ncbi:MULTISPECIES: DUF3795 domain-containing protein [unclassified Methanoregula]|uniref:DUF3795 domain-containing protein n=1 Tax=unclassified Methanoregula TaxID=2649730 RepID=UPI0009CE3802|nr:MULTISPECIES: DUF3795 domain-containing protein [unclassified Methanoregula]OPX64561.1 MAG: hypothetical protein A4E33_00808 [Methanoregula sp. PtaB.Bin085]OPY33314.1 MAG: hypothetical protein A4E34_02019 [Methanoregula sp. PtaU1.Bin006]
MHIRYPETGICGLSCRLCPSYHTDGPSRCGGCKTESRMGAGCPFITCALKKKGVEFCRDCGENETCDRWKKHREAGKRADSFKCYQTLEDDIAFVQRNGIEAFEEIQKKRERLLKEMLKEFNEGRSKSYFCIAATVLEIPELEGALARAKNDAGGLDMKGKARALHAILDQVATRKNYCLKLRK